MLLLALLATLMYSNTFSSPFHLDDFPYIAENPKVKHLAHFLDLSGTRYLTLLTFALNYAVGGLNVLGYHLVNLVIHITNAFLVYCLARLLFRTPTMASSDTTHPDRSVWVALATALLFVVHPIQTQAVTYIAQRFTSLAALLYLLAVVCYLHWRLVPPEKRSRYLWYGAAWLATVLAMKTKEISFTLPLMLLMVEAVFFWPIMRPRWITLIPFLLALLIIPMSRVDVLGGPEGLARQTMQVSRLEYLWTQFRVIMTYLRLLVLPIHQALDYDYPLSHSLFELPVLLSFLAICFLVAGSGFLVGHARRSPSNGIFHLIGFGFLWFFLALAVESSLIPIEDVIFEHRLYLPSMGVFLAMSAGTTRLLMGRAGGWGFRGWGTVSLCMAVLVLGTATYRRNHVWQTELNMQLDMVNKAPKKARPHIGLGSVYQRQGRFEEAIHEYRVALTLNPTYYALAYNNLGTVYQAQGRLDEAIQAYQQAIQLTPSAAIIHHSLGNAYLVQGQVEAAIEEYHRALELAPDLSIAHYNLGNAYLARRRFADAIQAYQRAIQLKPEAAQAHERLGYVYAVQGRFEEAVAAFEEALTLAPAFAEAARNLGNAYRELGRLTEASQAYEEALRLRPDSVDVHNDLGIVYAKQERRSEAIREFQRALAINPQDAKVHTNLGMVFTQDGRIEEAKTEFHRALEVEPDNADARRVLETLSR